MLNRKRTIEGHIKTNDDQVYVPFKTRIPAGHCKFKINVPDRYAQQDFFFSSLLLVPDFYSTEAVLESLTDQVENNTPVNYDIALKAFFVSKPSMFPEKFEMPTTVTTTQDLVTKINAFFEAHKPAACKHLGCEDVVNWLQSLNNGNDVILKFLKIFEIFHRFLKLRRFHFY